MKVTLFGFSKKEKKALNKARAALDGVAPPASVPTVSNPVVTIPATGDLRAYLSKRSEQRPVPPSAGLKSQPTSEPDRTPLKQHESSQRRFEPKRASETRSHRTPPPPRKTLSPRSRRSFSPRRSSPPRRTLSPRSRFPKQRRSPSPRLPRRIQSPRRSHPSPPRRTSPPRFGHSLSPMRTQIRGQFNTSPPRRSPSPRFQRSLSPIRTQFPGPHYDLPPRHRSRSPRLKHSLSPLAVHRPRPYYDSQPSRRSPSPRIRHSLSPIGKHSPIPYSAPRLALSPRLRRSPSPPGRVRSSSPTFQQTQQGVMLSPRPRRFPSPRRAINPLPVNVNDPERNFAGIIFSNVQQKLFTKPVLLIYSSQLLDELKQCIYYFNL